jgi:hypothetical protein
MRSGSAPAWARQLVMAVCAEAGTPPPAVLRWRRSPRDPSTGLANRRQGSIAVTAGHDPADARHTLLHELAHWLTPDQPRRGTRGRGRTEHHGAAFYATALALYARHGDELAASLRREAARYPSVLRHASAAGLAEAALIAEERGAARAAARAAGGRRWRLVVPEHAVTVIRDGRWYVCATCGHRMVGRVLARAVRRGRRERHALWTRDSPEAPRQADGDW